MRIAAGAEWGSEHPVARAIVSAHGGAAPVAESFASHAGFGVQALLEGSLVVAGRPKWVEDQWSVHLPIRFRGEAEMLEAAGGTVIAVAHDGDFLGIVAVSDTVKPTSEDAIGRFRALGLRPVLLTGDNAGAAEHIAGLLGIDEVRAGVTPAGKLEVIRELQSAGRVVAMVGDGVNDRPPRGRDRHGADRSRQRPERQCDCARREHHRLTDHRDHHDGGHSRDTLTVRGRPHPTAGPRPRRPPP